MAADLAYDVAVTRSASSTIEHPATVAGRLAAVITAALVCVKSGPDPDLWGHLRFGLDLLNTGRLTSIDPYSFTQDVPWINHEWLSELLFALAFRAGGVTGLTMLKCAVVGAAFWLLARLAASARVELRGWLLAVAFINVVPIAITFRPQLWTILGLSLVCTTLAGRLRFRWLPLIFVVWANMHGGWIVGAAVCGLWIVGRALDQRVVRPLLAPAAALVTSVGATILNPYGWRLWRFLWETVGVSRPDITEWRPYWEAFEVTHAVLLPLAVGVLVATLIVRWRMFSWARLLPAVWLGVNALAVSRLAGLFALLSFFAVVEAWSTDADRALDGPTRKTSGLSFRPTFVIDLAVLMAVTVPLLLSQGRCLEVPEDWRPDPVAASALNDPDVAGRLVVPFDWGEYALWTWGPRLKVSIDGRRETIYSAAVIEEQQLVERGRPDVLELFVGRTHPEYAWLRGPADGAAARWFASNGYVLDVDTGKSVVARRQDLRPLRLGTTMSSCAP